MAFLYGLIAVLFIVFLLGYVRIKKPVFGNSLIAITIILISLSTFFYFQMDNRIEKKEHLISVDEIVLSQIHSSLSYGNNYKLTAQVENLSKRYRLQAINIQINFLKCIAAQETESCSILKTHQYRIDTRLSPNTSAQIEKYIMLDDIGSISDNEILKWKIEVLSGVAR